jgi:hypothetical protein
MMQSILKMAMRKASLTGLAPWVSEWALLATAPGEINNGSMQKRRRMSNRRMETEAEAAYPSMSRVRMNSERTKMMRPARLPGST